MGLLKALFGGRNRTSRRDREERDDPPASGDVGELVGDLAKGADAGPPVADVTGDSSPKQVVRYVFQRLAAGEPAARLRADLVRRGLSGKVADSYIDLVQTTLFKG